MKKIYVDADACPVKDEIVKVATRHKIQVFMVCNGGIRPFRNNLINLIIVSEGSDEADKWIFENIKTEDIVITSDIPLASKCIDKGASVLKHDGFILNVMNITTGGLGHPASLAGHTFSVDMKGHTFSVKRARENPGGPDLLAVWGVLS